VKSTVQKNENPKVTTSGSETGIEKITGETVSRSAADVNRDKKGTGGYCSLSHCDRGGLDPQACVFCACLDCHKTYCECPEGDPL
jgi:hypothetical protein